MRLVHILSGLEVGGKERVVLELATRARRAGWDQRLVLFDTPYRDDTLDLDPGAVPHAFLARGPGLDLCFALALAAHARASACEVLHAHNDTALVYCALAGLRLGRARPRIVATFHTRPGHVTRGARWLTRWASRRVDGVTAVSADLAEHLLATGWVARCETLWNGIDLEAYAPGGDDGGWRRRLALAAEAVLVLHVGRHDPVKRQSDLIQAARLVRARGLDARFVLVGRGPLSEALRSEARDVPELVFVERVHDVAALMRAADLVVLCSDQEAAPRVLLEAMACGRAVVATDVGGCRRMLTDAQGELAGVLVPPRAPAALAEALARLAADPVHRRALGERARRRAHDFSQHLEWERYCALWGAAPP